jgi:DNA-binding NarL/FixJ family response regulator
MRNWACNRRNVLLIAAAVGTFGLMLAEELGTSDEALTLQQMLLEALDLAVLVGCTATTAVLVSRVRAQEENGVLLRQDIDLVRVRSEQWSREMAGRLRELGAAIQDQFEAWGLTRAEQEVGLLMLKGFSHKEIARLRNTSESTIRQQAAAVYQKANLSGRAALSAFFMEDLLLPGQPTLSNGFARNSGEIVYRT